MEEIKMKYSDYSAYFAPVVTKETDIVVQSAKGIWITDVDGNKYMDFVQGIAVNALGHCFETVVRAIQEQAANIIHASLNIVSYPATMEFAKRLSESTPGSLNVSFFSNGGAEAVDGALKLAKIATGRPGIIAFRGSFHGRTIGATSITGSKARYRKHLEPLMPSVYFSGYPYYFHRDIDLSEAEYAERRLAELREIISYTIDPSDVAAIIVEPVQGEGGYIVPHPEFLSGLREICDKNGILLIFDEIQSGFGRTGKMWASQHFGIIPDIMTAGKAIAGGLPMSAIISSKEIMDKWERGTHGTTFGGNPVCAAAGLAVLDALQGEVLENCRIQGDYLSERLKELKDKHPVVGDVRGLGLMKAIEFVEPGTRTPNPAAMSKVILAARKKGLLLLSCGIFQNTIRLAPPLNITRDELDQALETIDSCIGFAV
ncbi:MAG: aspartate aminotransferase family protein [Clostridiales bacterium]|jgi:4-aminobutyrate aminotransferase|nr:aspartate aminotransferase family protein [Clostridiales bacterium]